MSLNLWMRMYFWDWREAGFCWNLSTKPDRQFQLHLEAEFAYFCCFGLVHSVGFFFEIQCHLIPYNCLFVTVQFNKNLLASRGIKFRPQKNPAEEERERWRVAHWAWEWQLQCVVETFFSASQCVEGKSMNMAEAGDFILLNHSGRFRFPCNTIRWADRLFFAAGAKAARRLFPRETPPAEVPERVNPPASGDGGIEVDDFFGEPLSSSSKPPKDRDEYQPVQHVDDLQDSEPQRESRPRRSHQMLARMSMTECTLSVHGVHFVWRAKHVKMHTTNS